MPHQHAAAMPAMGRMRDDRCWPSSEARLALLLGLLATRLVIASAREVDSCSICSRAAALLRPTPECSKSTPRRSAGPGHVADGKEERLYPVKMTDGPLTIYETCQLGHSTKC